MHLHRFDFRIRQRPLQQSRALRPIHPLPRHSMFMSRVVMICPGRLIAIVAIGMLSPMIVAEKTASIAMFFMAYPPF